MLARNRSRHPMKMPSGSLRNRKPSSAPRVAVPSSLRRYPKPYTAAARNKALAITRNSFPGASRAIHESPAVIAGDKQSHTTATECHTAPSKSNIRRMARKGGTIATQPATAGIRMTLHNIMSVLQHRQLVGVNVVEFAVDLEDDDANDKDDHKDVQQDAHFNQ